MCQTRIYTDANRLDPGQLPIYVTRQLVRDPTSLYLSIPFHIKNKHNLTYLTADDI